MHINNSIMKITERYNLGKTQAEVDFIDIDTDRDIQLFIDPFFLSKRKDRWSHEASKTIRSFFEHTLNLIRNKNLDEGKELFDHLHEPNSTCLGLSKGKPQGRGVGDKDTIDIFDNLVKSKAVQTGLIQDIEDNLIFVDGFGKDKLSDMTTNIIRKHLIEYTQAQCKLNKIPLNPNVPSGFFWNRSTLEWEQEYTDMLVVDSKKILLVPKGIVSFCNEYTPQKYYQHFVLNFMQNEHLKLNSALVQKSPTGRKFVTKKSIQKQQPLSKSFLVNFSKRNPDVFTDFKKQLGDKDIESLTNFELSDFNKQKLISNLITKLKQIPSGSNDATLYHKTISGILEVLFYPNLMNPTLEREIHSGRKRIDITFDNAAKQGVFDRLSYTFKLPCPYIMVECKNYSFDPKNPELDQLGGRFSLNRGKVGFLLCRTIDNYSSFLKRCTDTYKDDRGLIIPLTDNDIIKMLENYDNWQSDYIDNYLTNIIREITLT